MDTKVKTDIENLRINGDRLWASLMELAQIGATPKGGVCRLTLTDLDKQGRDLVTRWGREAGMTVTIDKIGMVIDFRDGPTLARDIESERTAVTKVVEKAGIGK